MYVSLLFLNGASLVTQTDNNPPANAGDSGSIPGSERSPGVGDGDTMQYFYLGNPMDREPGGLQSMGSQRVRHSLVTKQQQQYFKHDCCVYVY